VNAFWDRESWEDDEGRLGAYSRCGTDGGLVVHSRKRIFHGTLAVRYCLKHAPTLW
jgi:hypothetical protein